MNYTLGFVLGFGHGLFVAYVVVVLRRTRHNNPVTILETDETGIWWNDVDRQAWSDRECLPDNRDNKRPVFLKDLPDDLF